MNTDIFTIVNKTTLKWALSKCAATSRQRTAVATSAEAATTCDRVKTQIYGN